MQSKGFLSSLAGITVKDPLRLVVSLALIVGMIALSTNFTSAAFSDTESVYHTVSTGQINLTINTSENKPWLIEGLMPGDTTGWDWIDLMNVGDAPFNAYLHFAIDGSKVDGEDDFSSDLYDVLEIELVTGEGDECVDNQIPLYSGLLSELDALSAVNVNESWHHNMKLPVGWSIRVCQRLHFPSEHIDNDDLSGVWTAFTEVVEALPN